MTHFLGIALLVRWGSILPWISNLTIGFAVWSLLMTWFFSYRKYSRINEMFDACGSDEKVRELLVLAYRGVSQLMIIPTLVVCNLFVGLAWAAAALKKAGG
ncbi:MAG: hypothetical protein HY858_00895 [Candidatus Solibacter usitatus]|nr:hypothetical protein [Candidatus Solibacter usitatus]